MKISKKDLIQMIDEALIEVICESCGILDEKYIGFKKLTRKLAARGVKNPKALAAWIGRKKYGKKTFQKAAATGKSLRGKES